MNIFILLNDCCQHSNLAMVRELLSEHILAHLEQQTHLDHLTWGVGVEHRVDNSVASNLRFPLMRKAALKITLKLAPLLMRKFKHTPPGVERAINWEDIQGTLYAVTCQFG
jgi:hypothetical protein